MIISIIILVISFILDGLITNYLPYLVNDLSLFTPLFTLVSLFIIYPFYRKKEKIYFVTIIVIGLMYDLFYTNLLFFNAVLFFIIGILIKYIYENFEINHFKLILYLVLLIICYESLTGIILYIYNMVPVTLYKIFYKIIHSLILNIIYGEVLYLIIRLIPKKYKKISIN